MRAPRPVRRASAGLGSVTRRLSLRARLLAGLLVVAATGLVVADVVVYGQVDSFLTNQIDQQLPSTLNPYIRHVLQAFSGSPLFPGSNLVDFQQDTPRGAYGAVIYGRGTVWSQTFQGNSPLGPAPVIPADLVAATARSTDTIVVPALGDEPVLRFSAAAIGDPSFRYRLIAVSLPTRPTATVAVVALPLAGVDAALHHLIGVDLVASTAVLLLLAGLGFLVVRLGMRPLVEIEDTAEAIAAGDLSRRVARDEQATEVGRLGASLNAMLGQIEHAFAEQRGSEQRLRQFLADASHELRTPVTSIRGYSELFRRGAASHPEDLALAMRRIEDESIRMGGLVDDLLLLARLDQGRPLQLERVDLVAVATDAAADAQVVASDRSVSLEAPVPVTVMGDEEQLLQIATNLVQNAVRHTPPGTPVTVTVSASAATAVLSVRDEGPGMAPEHAARVFERFYRADPSRTRQSGGTGLGLSIVQSIAQAHGGRARLRTAPGEGSTFEVELPLAGAPPGGPGAAGGGGDPAEHSTGAEDGDARAWGNGARHDEERSGSSRSDR